MAWYDQHPFCQACRSTGKRLHPGGYRINGTRTSTGARIWSRMPIIPGDTDG